MKEVDERGIITYKDRRGELHRLDGPARLWNKGELGYEHEWYRNNRLHRLDGPAIEYLDGTHEYWIDGKKYSKEEYQMIMFSLGVQV